MNPVSIPSDILHAMQHSQDDVYMPWLDAVNDQDADLLNNIFSAMLVEPLVYNHPPLPTEKILCRLLDRWNNTYKTSAPLAIVDVLEEHFLSVIAYGTDNPAWLSWILTPLHTSQEISVLSNALNCSSGHEKYNTFNALWAIAMSVPEHAQTLDTPDAFSPLVFLLHRSLSLPSFFPILHNNITTHLSPETQLFAQRHLATRAFETGCHTDMLQWLMDNGFSQKEMEEVADLDHYLNLSMSPSSLASYAWMWATRNTHQWSFQQPPSAQKFLLAVAARTHILNTAGSPPPPAADVIHLATKIFLEGCGGQTNVLHELINHAIVHHRFPNLTWILDVAAPDQVHGLLDPKWSELHPNPHWTSHPKAQAAMLQDHLASTVGVSRPSKKM